MQAPFDFQNSQPVLNFLKHDSSNSQAELFKQPDSQQSSLKIEESQYGYSNHIDLPSKFQQEKKVGRQSKNSQKKKSFYKDKMASLMEDQGQGKNSYKYSDYAHSGRGKNPIDRDEQLRRNRESAKQSRQRRKEYVQTLQDKNKEYKKLIDQLSDKLRQAEIERDRLRETNKSYVKSFFEAKSQSYEKLREIIETGEKNKKGKISQQLQSLKSKYGAAGSERVAATDYYVRQVIQNLIGDIHKYLVSCAINNSGLFGLGEWSNLDTDICKILNVNKPIRVTLSQKFRERMLIQFQNFKDITQNFYDAYRSVQTQAKVIQRIFDEISLEFEDDSIARLLLWLEESKFNKDVKKMRAFWFQAVEEREETMDKIRKIPRNQ